MKKYFILFLLTILNYCCDAQMKDYRVVFDMSIRDSVSQQAVIREVELIKNSSPEAKIEVVIYGKALNMVLKDKSVYESAIQKLLAMKDVSIKVCSITLSRNNVDKSQLLNGIEVVPDGIYEIVSKQKEGWGYIKVAH